MQNTFYQGDCKFVLKHDIDIESVDLIYLDPPFFTGKVQKGTWEPENMEISYDDSKRFWGDTEKVREMRHLAPEWIKHIAVKRPDFASYLFYMMERLRLCESRLKKTGSIYLHCDYNASHYLKMVMDEVFGVKNFKNEIIWHFSKMSNVNRYWIQNHNVLFLYTKSDNYTFSPQYNTNEERALYGRFENYISEDSKLYYKAIKGLSQQLLSHYIERAKKKLGRDLLDEDVVLDFSSEKDRCQKMDDVWFVPILKGNFSEYIGYPTQKPLALLERIVLASSNEGDTVLDPFCGCGTTIIAAHKLNRKWIGIDLNKEAYDVLVEKRFRQPSMEALLDPAYTEHQFISRELEAAKSMPANKFEHWVNEFYKADKPVDKGVDGITPTGVSIQTKAWQSYKVDHNVVHQFWSQAQVHPSVPQPASKIRLVSQWGFDDSATRAAFEIKSRFDVEVELITPEDMLQVNGATK